MNIDADHIKHMIVSGFYYDIKTDGTKIWGYNQWGLVGDSIGLLARNFLDDGYSVIINGYIDEPGWTNIQKHVTITQKVLLLPQLETVLQRDKGRGQEVRMGLEAVNEHHSHFSSDGFFQDFVRIDTTDHSVDETAGKLLEMINKIDEQKQ